VHRCAALVHSCEPARRLGSVSAVSAVFAVLVSCGGFIFACSVSTFFIYYRFNIVPLLIRRAFSSILAVVASHWGTVPLSTLRSLGAGLLVPRPLSLGEKVRNIFKYRRVPHLPSHHALPIAVIALV
jgi:hypothetical protein